jgi:16S rRNA processing protein RimM
VKFITVAKILGPHGVRGYVKIIPTTDFPQKLLGRKSVYIEVEGGVPVFAKIERITSAGERMLLKLAGVDSRDEAGRLSGGYLEIPVDELEPLGENEFYFHELIGLDVVDLHLGSLGELKEIIRTQAGDIYLVRNGDGRERLIPAVKEFISRVDLSHGTMTTDLPDGIITDESDADNHH